MTASSGWSIQSASGTRSTASACGTTRSPPTAMTAAPRARTSCMLEITLSTTGESVDGLRAGAEQLGDRVRQPLDLGDQLAQALRRERAAQLGRAQRQQVHR